MLVKDRPGLSVYLAERHGLEPARPLQAEVEAANAGEEGKDAIRHTPPRARVRGRVMR